MAAGEADVLLADGATVHIRPIQPEDADAVVALHSRFSERTRYLRYFSPYPRIPAADLRRFVNVDHHDREALVVSSGGQLIAIGRYERLGDGSPDAEVAFVVEDAHQGRGIGSVLLEHLAAAAPRAGITRFVAEVLPQNGAMVRVFSDAGFEVTRRYADGVVHLTFPVAPTDRSLAVQWRREQRTEAASIARLLAPRGVALYGVRADSGATALRHLVASGFSGTLCVVDPAASGDHAGVPVVRSASAASGPVDLAVVATPAADVPGAVTDLAAADGHGLIVVSPGFTDAALSGLGHAAATDAPGVREQRDLVAAARRAGLRLIGPGSLGAQRVDGLNASLAPALPPGRIGLFCHSAAIGAVLLAEARRRGLGASTFVSAGNRADVSGNDLLQFWTEDPATDVVLMYLETLGNPRKFARIARTLGRDKPIVLITSAGTGAGDPAAVAALVARSGVIRVDTIGELFDVGALLEAQPLPAGPSVAVVAGDAALAALGARVCARAGLDVAPGYPAPSSPDQAAAVRDAVADDAVHAVVAIVPPPPSGPSDAAWLEQAVAGADKPVVAVLLGTEGARLLPAGVPGYPTVEEAARALARVVTYAAWRREPAGDLIPLSDVDAGRAGEVAARSGPVEELLAAYGVAVLPERAAGSAEEVVAAARELATGSLDGSAQREVAWWPLVLKATAPGLRHRLDLGAVRLDLADEAAVRRAYRDVARAFGPEVVVQRMARPGVACVVEVVDHPAFGPVVGFGLGGVATDLLGDRAWRAAPLTDRDAQQLVRAPRAAPLLFGHRGAAPADVDALVDLLLRMGQLAADQTTVRRLVLNPVLAHAEGLTVLHAEVAYGTPAARPDTGPRRLGL
ncbi:GNAT family N-acetyltransferase [Luedemannella helvata]|uniref:Bifunctional GNAT family N-acetyltransferase/acetate--CoA ligase family protein n=1 Tax=Luedemannella helvata TaxID=349315 RepID=A0ABN2KSU7_9ACTN